MTQLKIKIWAYNEESEKICLLLDKEANIVLKSSKDEMWTFLKIIGSEKDYKVSMNITDLIKDIEEQIEAITGNEAYIVSKNNR